MQTELLVSVWAPWHRNLSKSGKSIYRRSPWAWLPNLDSCELWREDCNSDSSGNRCRNVLYQTSLTIICLYLGEKREKRKMTELENQRKQSVTRLHLNLPKLNGVMGGGRGAVIINTTHDKSVHRLWQAAQSHVQTSTEKTVLIRHLRAAGRSTQRKVGVFTGCRFSGERKGFLHHLLSIG